MMKPALGAAGPTKLIPCSGCHTGVYELLYRQLAAENGATGRRGKLAQIVLPNTLVLTEGQCSVWYRSDSAKRLKW